VVGRVLVGPPFDRVDELDHWLPPGSTTDDLVRWRRPDLFFTPLSVFRTLPIG
jgi:hypothetical protein